MQKKMIAFIGVIVILFVALYFVVSAKNNRAVEGNPYGKDDLEQSTIDLLDNPLYQHIITPNKLEEKLDKKEDITVYFFSPECSYCMETTPILFPLADSMDVDIQQLNLLEYPDEASKFKIEGTPTLIHFKDGQETDRLVGLQEEEDFKTFLSEEVLDKK
ncbi:thioredoxin family protein [Virgibacillus soli]|uniref:Thioredoxin family protein n=1 Tax=Paracerasibacillus soli TaxID=480284 RepID=A0ABU5CPS7_9BACI|nr:thioredoxin family protein [Virgibacillus soli]MDY0407832.1 thioredoxin family protein [Virgibacillus soli]